MSKEEYEYLLRGMEEELPRLVRNFRKGLFKLNSEKDISKKNGDKLDSIIIDFVDELMKEILDEVMQTYEDDINICKENGLDTTKPEFYLSELRSIITSIEAIRNNN